MKSYFLKIFYPLIVVTMAVFSGCFGPLAAPVPPDTGRVAIHIGAAEARTVAPATSSFTKFILTFSSASAAYGPVEIRNGSSATADLPPGSWTITATGYVGTVEAAEGRTELSVSGGALTPATIVLGPKTTAAGTGTLSYAITTPPGAAGFLILTTAAGGVVSGGPLALAPGTSNAGTATLAPGQYLARVRLEKGGGSAGLAEALHVYAGLTSALPARTYTDSDFRAVPVWDPLLESLAGVWYSRYPGIGRLDGYRIGRWKNFDTIMTAAKVGLFPALQRLTYTDQSGSAVPWDDDFFVFYDDTVYGQQEDGSGGSPLSAAMGYIGIVRAVNSFNGPDQGAIIIEYFEGCAPQWHGAIKGGQLPFFGMYYQKTGADTAQFANAVDVDAMDAGENYYTDTATLEEAIAKNTADKNFVVWDVVTPSER
jgi:hypothetical protein